jgi:hypothetical protein
MKVSVPETPPPGAGLTIARLTGPGCVRSLAGTCAVTALALAYMVRRLAPCHCTTEFGTKLLPVTASVKDAPPAIADWGKTDCKVGAGFDTDALPPVFSGVLPPLDPAPPQPRSPPNAMQMQEDCRMTTTILVPNSIGRMRLSRVERPSDRQYETKICGDGEAYLAALR